MLLREAEGHADTRVYRHKLGAAGVVGNL